MKRTASIFMLLLLLFVLAACGAESEPPVTSTQTTALTTEPVSTSSTLVTTTRAQTAPETPLTEESAKRILAARDDRAELIALYPSGRTDYLLYRLSDGLVRVDAYDGKTGVLIEKDILANRFLADRRICAYDAEELGNGTLALYVSELTEAGGLVYPERLVLREESGEIVLTTPTGMGRESLPLLFPVVSLGNAWAAPELAECRTGLDCVTFALSAPDGVDMEGGECFPQTEFSYDAETNTMVVTMHNTQLSENTPVVAEQKRLVEAVAVKETADGLEIHIRLTAQVFSYSCDMRTIFDPNDAHNTLGVLEIFFFQRDLSAVTPIGVLPVTEVPPIVDETSPVPSPEAAFASYYAFQNTPVLEFARELTETAEYRFVRVSDGIPAGQYSRIDRYDRATGQIDGYLLPGIVAWEVAGRGDFLTVYTVGDDEPNSAFPRKWELIFKDAMLTLTEVEHWVNLSDDGYCLHSDGRTDVPLPDWWQPDELTAISCGFDGLSLLTSRPLGFVGAGSAQVRTPMTVSYDETANVMTLHFPRVSCDLDALTAAAAMVQNERVTAVSLRAEGEGIAIVLQLAPDVRSYTLTRTYVDTPEHTLYGQPYATAIHIRFSVYPLEEN